MAPVDRHAANPPVPDDAIVEALDHMDPAIAGVPLYRHQSAPCAVEAGDLDPRVWGTRHQCDPANHI